MKVLQIVEESPSLDFSLPLFNSLNSQDEIVVFSTKPSFNQWYDESPHGLIFKESNIKFFSSVDSMKLPSLIKGLLKKILGRNRDNVNNIILKVIYKLLNKFVSLYSNPVKFLKSELNGDPDLVFIDTRNDLIPNNINYKIFSWLNKNYIKTVGLPVSLYTLEGVKWSPITPFGIHKLNYDPFKKFPTNYSHWLTSKQPYVISQLDSVSHNIVGYPGVDSKWLDLFKYNHKKQKSSRELNILLNVRHFGKKRSLTPASGKYIYEDVYNFFYELKKIIKSCEDFKINLFIKPHYYVNFKEFRKMLNKLEITNYKFLRTSIYFALKDINFVVGLHSSVNLISILSGIPTLIFPQVLTEKFMDEDKKSNKIYKNLNGYSESIEDFNSLFRKYLDIDYRDRHIEEDKIHLREIFPDNSIDKIINIIKS